MAEFRMPSLGADMEAGKLLQWRIAPGDRVHRGDIVATVDTSKAEIDIEVFEDGVVDELIVQPGEQVPVGAVLATIRAETAAPAPREAPSSESAAGAPQAPEDESAGGAAEPAAAAPPPPAEPVALASPPVATAPLPPAAEPAAPPLATSPPPPAAEPVAPPVAISPPPSADGERVLASPYARALAVERGVDLAALVGRGPGGAVLAADVPAAAAPADRSASMRQAIAAAMARSKREIPHYYLASPIDMSAALAWLAAHNAELPVGERLLPAVLTLKATALAVREVPALNGYWIDDASRPSQAVHVGVAIALRSGGLIAPAIHDADGKSLGELMGDLRDLVRRVRTGGLRSSELTDPTITVTSLGERGAGTVYGVIYPPQVALVGFGAIAERPWAQDGMIGARPVLEATLAADHRASDGQQGSALLGAIDRHLQEPETL